VLQLLRCGKRYIATYLENRYDDKMHLGKGKYGTNTPTPPPPPTHKKKQKKKQKKKKKKKQQTKHTKT